MVAYPVPGPRSQRGSVQLPFLVAAHEPLTTLKIFYKKPLFLTP